MAKKFIELIMNDGSQGGGECSGNHIIEVDQLPTENIDENALYLYDGAYYKYSTGFSDVFIVMGSQSMTFSDLAAQIGATISFNTIPTKTTDGILESDANTSLHLYYIEDEDDVFLYYLGVIWYSLADMDMGSYAGTITDVSEATADGYYAMMGGWIVFREGTPVVRVDELPTESIDANVVYFCNQKYYVYSFDEWIEFLHPTEKLEITKNGTYDVTDKASVEVNVKAPEILVVQSVTNLPYKIYGSVAYVLEG